MRLRAHRRRRQDGFTLVELTVALLAGLIVAMGIVTLSREATNTFHEEARASAAEAALRTAVDRLRSDLGRAGYMSTGNILLDPQVAYVPGQTKVSTIQPAMTALAGLGGILWIPGGSLQNGLPLSAQTSQQITLSPDRIRIAGNMTSTEQFDVQMVTPSATGNCTRILLNPNAPAMHRFLTVTNLDPTNPDPTELRRLFFPSEDSQSDYQFIVRLVDNTGKAQYLATCPEKQIAGFVPGGTLLPNGSASTIPTPYLEVDTQNTPILTGKMTGTNGGVTGLGAGSFLNAVDVVQWEVTQAQSVLAPEPPDFVLAMNNAAVTGGADPAKYDLMRSFIDAKGKIVPGTREIVAEYAVDFSFAFSVEQGTVAAPRIVSYPFDDAADNQVYATPTVTNLSNVGPQRIRSVRARIVTRTAQPDRGVNIPPSPANYANQLFMYRYCVLTTCVAKPALGVLQWARTRTLTTEVALQNLARGFY